MIIISRHSSVYATTFIDSLFIALKPLNTHAHERKVKLRANLDIGSTGKHGGNKPCNLNRI
jgi:hypothetical protein